MPTTTREYALLCIMSSHKEKAFLKGLKESKDNTDYKKHLAREKDLTDLGWIPFLTSEGYGINAHGYFGVAYSKADHVAKTMEIVFAHRGTCFDQERAGNVIADVGIALREKPKILEEAAFKYINTTFKLFDHDNTDGKIYHFNYEVIKITHTGFSLGGFIAGASAALYGKSFDDTHAVTFDAPGIGALNFDQQQQKAEKIINYVTIPNIVNTCNVHVGEVRMMTAYSELLKKQTTQITANFEVNFKNFQLFSLQNMLAIPSLDDVFESHDLDKLIGNIESDENSLEGEPAYKSMYHWPAAVNEPIYDKQPPNLLGLAASGTYTDGVDALMRIIGSAYAAYQENPMPALPLLIWRNTHTTEQGGVVGFRHFRLNKVFHTENDHLSFLFSFSMVTLIVGLATSKSANKSNTDQKDSKTAPLSNTAATASNSKTSGVTALLSSSLSKTLSPNSANKAGEKQSNASNGASASAVGKTKNKDTNYQSPGNHGPN